LKFKCGTRLQTLQKSNGLTTASNEKRLLSGLVEWRKTKSLNLQKLSIELVNTEKSAYDYCRAGCVRRNCADI